MDQIWDYISPTVTDAATQMAIDAVLADLCNRESRRAFLRFYRMSPPAVTIGRNQRWRTVVDPERCRRNGWDWVRRPTGGGALLHHREINYAVALSHDLLIRPERGARLNVFNYIAVGMMAGLAKAGIQPALTSSRKQVAVEERSSAHGLCGAALTRFEISVGGRKAIAAAQLNLANASLQHGTIYLQAPALDDRFWPDSAHVASTGQSWWAWEIAGITLDDRWMTAVTALKEAFAQKLGIAWRLDATGWAASPEVSARKDQWLASRWHQTR